jgi:HNH endonuclease
VIRKTVRNRLRQFYPVEARWEPKNSVQHTAFQAMDVQYDHLLPLSRGGSNESNNLVMCAPCNYAQMQYALEEVGLSDPFAREPIGSTWDGSNVFSVAKPSGRQPSRQDALRAVDGIWVDVSPSSRRTEGRGDARSR